MAKTTTAKAGDMPNGNEYKNGNGNGTLVGIANLATTGVLLLAMFGLWWSVADPRARIEKLEDSIKAIHQELSIGYVSLREHNDLQARLRDKTDLLERKDADFLTKAQFDAWRNERDLYITTITKRIDAVNDRFEKLREHLVTHDTIQSQTHRIDQLYALIRELQQQVYQPRNGK